MDLDLVFVGTGGSVPTPQRALPALLIRRGSTHVLVDCGEGTQRQMMRGTGLSELDVVWITHAHTDHILGLPGMLKTFAMRERTTPLTLIGPRGIRAVLKDLARFIGRLPYELSVIEAGDGFVHPMDGFELRAFATEHGMPSIGMHLFEPDRPGRFDVVRARELGVAEGPDFGRLQRGETVAGSAGLVTPDMVLGDARYGRSIVVTGDTRPTSETVAVASGADVLVHEATFMDEDAARALQTSHSTAREAALVAAAADVALLAITHVSGRYHGRELCAEAQGIFEDTVCPRDYDIIEVPYAERGEPVLVPRQNGRPARQGDVEAAPLA